MELEPQGQWRAFKKGNVKAKSDLLAEMDVDDVNETSSGAAAEPVAPGDDVVMVLGEEGAGPEPEIPFASTIAEFLADPEAFRPRPSFFREYIEVSFPPSTAGPPGFSKFPFPSSLRNFC